MASVTIINQQYPPEVASTGQIFRAMAEHLSRNGVSVTVVTGTPYYPGMAGKCPRREVANGVRVKRLYNTTFPKKSFLGKFLNLFTFELSLFFHCIFCIAKDQVVLVATAPPMAVLCAAVGRFFRRYRVVMTVQDLYPDALAASGMSDRTKFTYRLLEGLMRRSMRSCDRVVTISTDMKNHLESHYGLRDVALIPNLFPETIAPVDANEAKATRGWADRLVVQYSGNFGVAHEFDTLLAAVRLLSDEPGILFQVAGDGRNFGRLRAACEAEKLANIVFEGYAPLDRLESHLGAADISVVILSAAFQHVLLPSKYYGILASGRATLLISGCESDILRDIRSEGVGYAFGHGEGERIADTLRALAKDPETLRRMGEKARNLYDRRYGKETILDAYSKLLTGFAGGA